ncbi:hypothetical protein JTE90_010217 [Oedothorax gibbosus]|uniref:Uncharacterized protein n=1 Tax=Oedothorax gibbosus TaxID=931172 RepID=A0AAV6UKA1_9ARAC|nr:hypothetical protein JTE90_010217 [Oedothorax gibbosus]
MNSSLKLSREANKRPERVEVFRVHFLNFVVSSQIQVSEDNERRGSLFVDRSAASIGRGRRLKRQFRPSRRRGLSAGIKIP